MMIKTLLLLGVISGTVVGGAAALNKGQSAQHQVNAQVSNSSAPSLKKTTYHQTPNSTQEKEQHADYEVTKDNKVGSSEYKMTS